MKEQLDKAALRNFYERHLLQDLLPFWIKALDKRRGGVYTCFTNAGDELLNKDKYTWSQGRFVWLWSRIAELCERNILPGSGEEFLQQAGKTAEFLKRFAIMDNGNCAFLLTEDGRMKESVPGQGYDTSIYADCFVALGLSEYSRVSRSEEIAEDALRLYDRIRERVQSGLIRSEPYPIPDGLKAHAVAMILLNISQQLMDALESFRHPEFERVRTACSDYAEQIIKEFRLSDNRIAELLPINGDTPQTLLCRHANPGHTLESMWFVMSAALRLNRRELIDEALPVIKRAFVTGWDSEEGGLFRFTDCEGGKPEGTKTGDAYEKLILETWDSKLWWPHSEALYCSLLGYELSGDREFLALYRKTHEYVFRTFPSPDRRIGEWIQIRDRFGRPLDKVVALPVKDPFHVIRNLLLIIELYSQP